MKNFSDQELLDLYFQSRATDDQISELEKRMLASPPLRKRYLDEAMSEADLRSFALREETDQETRVEAPEKAPVLAETRNTIPPRANYRRWQTAAAIAAVLVLASTINLMLPKSETLPNPVGTIASTEMAGWQSDQPTIEGAAFRPGTYLLQSGAATMSFHSGAEMILVAPAKFKIISDMSVTFDYGQASFNVPESAIGFQVNTRFGHVIDHGTSFSMQLPQNGDEAFLAVEEGEIAIHHHKGEVKHLLTDQVASVSQTQIAPIDQTDEGIFMPTSEVDQSKQVITLSTRGRENTIIYNNQFEGKLNPDFLLIKHHHRGMELERRGLFAFDVSKVPLKKITDINLVLNAVPTEWRKIGHIPPVSKFTLYGIPDDSREKWPTGHLKWEDAPTFEDATPLASFKIKRAEVRKVIELNTPELTRFIQSDTTGVVSFIVACKTPSNWFVHGIASSLHREAAPPSLELTIKK